MFHLLYPKHLAITSIIISTIFIHDAACAIGPLSGPSSSQWTPENSPFNLNQRQGVSDPLLFESQWQGPHTPSPVNWRFPFYTIMLDRFADGDPTNNDIMGSSWEWDPHQVNFRHGGDPKGAIPHLDYIHRLGARGVYIAGTPFLNMPWDFHQYNPIDFSITDPHMGTVQDWRDLIQAAHDRGMVVMVDITVETLGDLIQFDGFVNASAPFDLRGYTASYKYPSLSYPFFQINNTWDADCELPRFFNSDGYMVNDTFTRGCYASDFVQFGDLEAFGDHPPWARQLSKFAGVQDRLRDWSPRVQSRLVQLTCLLIDALDIDALRIDKATQASVDFMAGVWAPQVRDCAKKLGKNNFFLPGEITSGTDLGALYVGRGRMPNQRPVSITDMLDNSVGSTRVDGTVGNPDAYSMRVPPVYGLDGCAFHYSIYRGLMSFLNLEGDILAPFDVGADPVAAWNTMLVNMDYVNSFNGVVDTRDMFGSGNQDTFRWASLDTGPERLRLATMITTLLLPGIPLMYYGDEQGLYLHDSRAENYVYGRQPMSSSIAWQLHGCYTGNASYQFRDMPFSKKSRQGCRDASQSLDHFDPTANGYRFYQHVFAVRDQVPVLVDGLGVTTLMQIPLSSDKTNGDSNDGGSRRGGGIGQHVWSVTRRFLPEQRASKRQQPITDTTTSTFTPNATSSQTSQVVWFIYTNNPRTVVLTGTCGSSQPIWSPFPPGTVVQDIVSPFMTLTVQGATNQSTPSSAGCLDSITLPPYGFRVFVPVTSPAALIAIPPVVTHVWPGHDTRISINESITKTESDTGTELVLKLGFSDQMVCESVASAISFTTSSGIVPVIDTASVQCMSVVVDMTDVDHDPSVSVLAYATPSTVWMWQARVFNVREGFVQVTVSSSSAPGGVAGGGPVSANTGASILAPVTTMFRIGKEANPIVFPRPDHYDADLITTTIDGNLVLSHKATGADLFRVSTDYGRSWGAWTPYTTPSPIHYPNLSTTTTVHVIVDYWSRISGSAAHRVHSEITRESTRHGDWVSNPTRPKFLPSLKLLGQWNAWGHDTGVASPGNMVWDTSTTLWHVDVVADFPVNASLDVWGDGTVLFGDVDRDGVLDRLPPNSQDTPILLLPVPPLGFTGWRVHVNDATLSVTITPIGSAVLSIIYCVLLAVVPILCAVAASWSFRLVFYRIVWNKTGRGETDVAYRKSVEANRHHHDVSNTNQPHMENPDTLVSDTPKKRPKILMATLEYEIPDWNIKVRIGGLGVIASVMCTDLHNDLIWVVPKVGDVDYPYTDAIDPIPVTIDHHTYTITATRHQYRNVTFILLDAGVFRARSRQDPYPPQMDDVDSAVFYSAWNQAIAHVIRSTKPDVYHINDFHGALAPLYLLPTCPIPCALSLHNAEFQGLWAMRTSVEVDRLCAVFHLDKRLVERFVRYGNTFNLLHAAVRVLVVFQGGVGAGGVSDRYGERCHARYPTLWCLKEMLSIQNPNPQDKDVGGVVVATATASAPVGAPREYEKRDDGGSNHEDSAATTTITTTKISVTEPDSDEHNAAKIEAQRWAGLDPDASKTLLVFVGRFSRQKGIDLIADLAPIILDAFPSTQLVCVGPLIDLHGRLAELKLERIAQQYPNRVFVRAEFTAIPSCVFSGCDFVLLPSRDEPFGLVAVEFGRQGALGIGSFVGGLGTMPGWWFPIESDESDHLLSQFWHAVQLALVSTSRTRAEMRRHALEQRFPVAEWRANIEEMYRRVIDAFERHRSRSISKTRRGHGEGDNDVHSSTVTHIDMLGIEPDWPSVHQHESTPPTQDAHQVIAQHTKDVDRRDINRDSLHPVGPQEQGIPIGHKHVVSDPDAIDIAPRAAKDANAHAHSTLIASGVLVAGNFITANGSSSNMTGEGSSTDKINNNNSVDRASHDVDPAGDTPDNATLQSENSGGGGDQSEALSMYPEYQRVVAVNGVYTSTRSVPETAALRLQEQQHSTSMQSESPAPSVFSLQSLSVSMQSTPSTTRDQTHVQRLDPCVVAQIPDIVDEQPFEQFTDAAGTLRAAYATDLARLSRTNTLSRLCIDKGIRIAARRFFAERRVQVRDAVLVRLRSRGSSAMLTQTATRVMQSRMCGSGNSNGWPVYTLCLAIGQILSATTFQLVLLTSQSNSGFNVNVVVVGSIFIVADVAWWMLVSWRPSALCLSLPMGMYGVALASASVAAAIPASAALGVRYWLSHVALWIYVAASASGPLFFAFNFGEEAGVEMPQWILRAGIFEGIRQLWTFGLWFWQHQVPGAVLAGEVAPPQLSIAIASVFVAAGVLLCVVGAALYCGLPACYHHLPPSIPSLFSSFIRRRLVLWYFASEFLRSFWLSGAFGRNWQFLWTRPIPPVNTVLLILFFGGIWVAVLVTLAMRSRVHSWLLPVFAVGLLSPRWAQMSWAASSIGSSLAWMGSVGSHLSLALWLWLEVLDAVQAVGLSMMLMQTLTRMHVAGALMVGQALATMAFLLAAAVDPSEAGPNGIFPNLGLLGSASSTGGLGVKNGDIDLSGAAQMLQSAWFWAGLLTQIVVAVGFLVWFRREQLSKP